jgi:cytidylate kinase
VVVPTETSLRIRLVAPIWARIATVQKRRNLSFGEAQQWIEKTDRDRALFIKDHFHKEADDPHLHDLVLNTFRFSLETCAEIIIDVLHRMQAQARQSAEASVHIGAGSAS